MISCRSAPTGWRARQALTKTSVCGCRNANSPAAFEGLDELGRLMLTGPDGVTLVTAGEVFALGGR